jgi:DNA polymerase I
VIADAIYHDDEPPTIYTRYRDKDRVLIEKSESYNPYFFIPQTTPEFRLKSLIRSYPNATIHTETYKGLKGEALYKVSTNSPFEISRMSDMFSNTYEADVRFVDRYLIDNVQEMPKWKPRKWWYDIECNTGDDNFTTVIAVIDSDLDTPVVFAWADETTNCSYPNTGRWNEIYQREVRGEKYELHLCFSEKQLYENFIDFLHERDPDMMIAHAGTFFDIPHMIERLNKIYGHGGAAKLSPLGIIRYPKRGQRYYPTDQPIAGRWQFDTAAPASSHTGFESVWKDSGGGQLPNLKLNTIAEELGLGSKLTEEIEGMDIHNGWREYWSDFVDYCLLDTVLLRGIDEARNVTDFYVDMVQLCGVSMQSACNVTNFSRGLLSRRTNRIAPSRYYADKIDFQGAEFILKDSGLYENVAVLDYKGLYPSLITGHNLSYETKRDGPGEGIIQLENGSYWDQTKKGLLPEVVDYLFEYRAECKQKMKDAETKEERAAWNTTQSAVKRVMASLYGMTAHSGFGWADADIAHTILSEGRRCIRMLDTVATRLGYNVLYGFTDSAFIQVPFEDAETLASRITDAVQQATGNKMLFAQFEAYHKYWLLEKKNKYAGIVTWPPQDEGKMKTANFLKGSSLAPITKKVERIALTMICEGKPESQVRNAILELALPVRQGVVNLKEVTQQTRISQDPSKYKILSGASKAADYYNTHISKDDPFVGGDSVKWTYVKSVPSGMPPAKVVAYREEKEMKNYKLDATVILQKAIVKKLQGVYKILGWDLGAATGEPRPAQYW